MSHADHLVALVARAARLVEAEGNLRVAGGPQWKLQGRDEGGQFTGGMAGGASKLMELAKRPSRDVDLDEILEAAGHPADRLHTKQAKGWLTSTRNELRYQGFNEAAKVAQKGSMGMRDHWFMEDGTVDIDNPPREGRLTDDEVGRVVDADSDWLARLSDILKDLYQASR